jgi:transcriptional antiterminator/mannitol/fructose-specific phosphotransferase system IIA component (Ntr-type)
VNYDLQKINDWLFGRNLPLIQNKRAHGFTVDEETKDIISGTLSKVKLQEFIPSPMLRNDMMLVKIFMKNDYLSVNHFISSFKVSRNTVLTYIQKVRSEAEQIGISLKYSRQEGYWLDGDEMDIRTLILSSLARVVQQPRGLYILKTVYDEQKEAGAFDQSYEAIISSLNRIEDSLGISFVEERMKEFASFMTLLLARLEEDHAVSVTSSVMKTIQGTKDYQAVENMLDDLNAKLSENEKTYITILMLGLSLRHDSQIYQKQNSKEFNKITSEILSEFEMLAYVEFKNREQAVKSLLMHLKPAYYRHIFRIPLSNPYLETIKDEHFDLFLLVRKALRKFEKFVGSSLSDDEIGYITLHFGSFLNDQAIILTRKKGIIVCPNGLATSNMLKRQIERVVPELEIVKVSSIREYDDSREEVDIIFSTVPLRTEKPLIIVQPILTSMDKAKIIQEVDFILHGTKSLKPKVNRLMQVIKSFAEVHDEEGLYTAINDILNGNTLDNIGRYKPVLKELLTKDMIQFEEGVDNWEQAIRIGARPLLYTNAIGQRYVDAMIHNVNTLGAYIVLAPKVAVPHARPRDGVSKLGMSLLKLDRSVSFADNDPEKDVNIVIVLAAIDNESHLKALTQLMELLEEDGNIEKLIQADNLDPIIALIEQYS